MVQALEIACVEALRQRQPCIHPSEGQSGGTSVGEERMWEKPGGLTVQGPGEVWASWSGDGVSSRRVAGCICLWEGSWESAREAATVPRTAAMSVAWPRVMVGRGQHQGVESVGLARVCGGGLRRRWGSKEDVWDPGLSSLGDFPRRGPWGRHGFGLSSMECLEFEMPRETTAMGLGRSSPHPWQEEPQGEWGLEAARGSGKARGVGPGLGCGLRALPSACRSCDIPCLPCPHPHPRYNPWAPTTHRAPSCLPGATGHSWHQIALSSPPHRLPFT